MQSTRFSRNARLAAIAAVAVIAAAACSSEEPESDASQPSSAAAAVPWPVTDCGTYTGEGCAATEDLVDLDRPTFSNPTEITNPLYPISELDSVVLLGEVDDLPFRSETTLLPFTETVVWDGTPVEVVLVQYAAYSDGRITEVALDRYAQADDGSVWYFGEDVYDYDADAGAVALTEGTWLAGRDGSPAMIMPADPQLGDVFRPETVLGVVFEEVTVTEVDATFDGPLGPVDGILVGTELHLDESQSDKLFAPGYGEFYSESDGEVEALAIAVGVDRSDEPEPPELRGALTAAWGIVEAARLEEWEAVDAMLDRLTESWDAVSESAPPLLAEAMDTALIDLGAAVAGMDVAGTVQGAIDAAQSGLDLRLRYVPVPDVDVARFHLHSQQLRIAAAEADAGGVSAEVAVLEWIHQRVDQHLPEAARGRIATQLAQLRTVASAGNLAGAADVAARLAADLNGVAAGVSDWSAT